MDATLTRKDVVPMVLHRKHTASRRGTRGRTTYVGEQLLSQRIRIKIAPQRDEPSNNPSLSYVGNPVVSWARFRFVALHLSSTPPIGSKGLVRPSMQLHCTRNATQNLTFPTPSLPSIGCVFEEEQGKPNYT